MLQRIALMVKIGTAADARRGTLRVSSADTQQDVVVREVTFVLTLEREPNATFARGHIRLLPAGARYPIHGSAALFEALNTYLAEHDAQQ